MHLTQIGEERSTIQNIRFGVPLGSVLGPLLVVIHINDIDFATTRTGIIFYADDTVIYTKEDLDQILETSAIWLKKNCLTLNADITKTDRFYKKKNTLHLNILMIDNKEKHNVAVLNYIVVLLDKDLCFQQHAESVEKNNNILFLVLSLEELFKHKAACNSLYNICAAVAQYGLLIFGCAKYKFLEPLNLTINRLSRFLKFKKIYESIAATRRKLLIYIISKLHLHEILKTATKIIRCENSVSCLESLISKDEFHKITNGRTRLRKLCLLKNKCKKFFY